MRILQVITSLKTGGAEKLVHDITPRLMALGHQVDVVVFNGEATPLLTELEKKTRVFRLGNSFYNPLYIIQLAKIMRNYDIIHTHNSSPQLFAAIANLVCRKKLVTTEHNTDNRKRGNALLSAIDRWMYKQYPKIICISEIAEDKLREYLQASSDKIITINNGVDVEAIHQAEGLKDRDESKFLLLMVAAFRKQKDQDTLVKALKWLDDRFVVWFAGVDERLDAVKQLSKELGVDDRVKFLGLRTDVPRLLRTADVVVMSSHYEGLSLSNIEGMSADRPFVASDVNGLREVTKGYGILFPHEDAEALAREIKHLADDKDYYRQVAERCYERARQFDISTMVEKYNEVYLNLNSSVII